MRYASLFLWLLVPLALWLVVVFWGTPHVALSYRFYENGDRWNPRAHRHYIDCTYYGFLGAITIPAEDGTCPWIRFFQAAS